MRKFISVFAFFIGLGFSATAQDNPREFEMVEEDTTYVMKQYFMLIYLSGDNREEIPKDQSQKLQEGHLGHINKMAEAGVVQMAGPFGDNTEKRGILIFDVDTEEEVVEWVSEDPLVRKGRLKYEIHPWWTARGSCLE